MIGAMKLQPDDGPRSSLSIGPGFGQCSGISSEFVRRFAKGIGKLVWNTPGDRRKKIGRLVTRIPEVVELVGVNRPYLVFSGMFNF
ncbi:hypothetical protein B296_00040127 [Ensete ventricosum]|uniref:Uncharacterized protein n=1 Tax=Ensete ventricosum TaxID=4639 RepID=A0A426XEF6_ENSVE|nr:hypothetical protein B296_00040127 [Ensete ventricosum]